MVDSVEIESVRRFSRAFTSRIGVLDESYLGTGRPLGVSRLLFEVGEEGSSVADLRERLAIDSGYMSRLLRSLEGEGLVEVLPDPADKRRRSVHLTPKGRREHQRLEQRSVARVSGLLEPLSPRLRRELASGLARAEVIIASTSIRFSRVDPADPLAVEAVGRYFAELDHRFESGFDPGRGGAAADRVAMSPPNGVFVLLLTVEGALVGCGGVQSLDQETAEIKRMWIDDNWRGLGLGARLLEHLEGEALALGKSRVVLDTNNSLSEAISMYERAGYRRIDRYNDNPYAHHFFEKDVNE